MEDEWGTRECQWLKIAVRELVLEFPFSSILVVAALVQITDLSHLDYCPSVTQ